MSPILLGAQVTTIAIADAGNVLYAGDIRKAKMRQIINFLGIVGQQTKRPAIDKLL